MQIIIITKNTPKKGLVAEVVVVDVVLEVIERYS
jgi:hypothetical protein